MDYKKGYNIVKHCLVLIIIAVLISIIVVKYNVKPLQPVLMQEIIKTDKIDTDSFSERNLLNFMYVLDIKNPNIVLNQAKLETGNFTSDRFKKYNALFGFQVSDTQVIKYHSWKESVIHYKTWQMFRLKDSENYYDFLIRVKYASDSSYIKKLKQFSKSYKKKISVRYKIFR